MELLVSEAAYTLREGSEALRITRSTPATLTCLPAGITFPFPHQSLQPFLGQSKRVHIDMGHLPTSCT